MLRSRRLQRFALPAILLSAAILAGCTTPAPAGEPFPDPPRASMWELLGLDAGPDADALDAAFAQQVAALAEQSAAFAQQTDAELARAIRDQDGAAVKTAAYAVTPVTGPRTPGVDLPVVTQTGETTTDDVGGRPRTITKNSESTISDQREVTVNESVGTTGEPETGRGSIESVTSTTRVEPCAAGGEPVGDAIALAGMQLDVFREVAGHVARRAEELREREGLCVRILVDTHGETTLADGEQASFDARVVDPRTGEEIADAAIVAETSYGSVSPGSATGHGTFTVTASGDPDYRVRLTTQTPRGGHVAHVHYAAPGWRFEGVSYGYTIGDGFIAVEITWQGRVCGSFRDDWQLDWQIHSAYGSPSATGIKTPVEVSQVTHGDRALLVYEEVPDPADGEPPFRLVDRRREPGQGARAAAHRGAPRTARRAVRGRLTRGIHAPAPIRG